MPRIVETDNFGRDYPDERFLNIPSGPKEYLKPIADAINMAFASRPGDQRYWKIVDDDYVLEPGFEP